MTDALAKAMAVVTGLLLVTVLAVLYVTSRPPSGTQQVRVEFRDAFPLIEGMHVRVDGAKAGTVSKLDVNKRGLAEATLSIDSDIEAPRVDATAAVRQQETGAESYVDLSPGTARAPLPERDGTPTIACNARSADEPCERSLVAPRLDDLLNSFDKPAREGTRLLLSELSAAMDRRGADVNSAALELRPALVAGNRALAEVNRQRSALKQLITAAENVTGQGASRRRQLARLIDSLTATLDVTASEGRALDAGLQRLPATVTQTRATLAALRRAAVASRPLAGELRRGARPLASLVGKAPAFFADASVFVRRTRPSFALLTRTLRDAQPTLEAAPDRVVTGPFDLAPAIAKLVGGVFGNEDTIKALFGTGAFGIPAVSNERGAPALGPEYADRSFVRILGKVTCEWFGRPIAPGCLAGALKAARRSDSRRTDTRTKPAARKPSAPSAPASPKQDAKPASPAKPQLSPILDGLPDTVQKTVDGLLDTIGGVLDGGKPPGRDDSKRSLLDYLLAP